MKKKINKGFLTYLLIFLGLALAAVIICMTIMIVSPGVEIFGIRYGNYKNDESYLLFNVDGVAVSSSYTNIHGTEGYINKGNSDFDDIQINTNAYNVQIKKSSLSTTSVKLYTNIVYNGFFKPSAQVGAYFKADCKIEDHILKMSVFSPEGLSFTNSGSITLWLPSDYTSKNITINTTSGNINLGGVRETTENLNEFSAKNFSVSTTKGNITLNEKFSFTNATGLLNIGTEMGTFTAHSLNATEAVAKFDCGNGKFNLQDTNLDCKNLTIDGNNADIKLNRLTLHGSESTDVITFKAKSGRLTVDEIIGDLDVQSSTTHTNFDIKKITGQFLLRNGTYSNVKIQESNNNIIIKAEKADVVLGRLASGEVLVGNITGKTEVYNKSGTIKVYNASNEIDLYADTGKIEVENCSAKINRIQTNKGKISAKIIEVKAFDNLITSSNGEINIQFQVDLIFALTTSSSKSVNINYGGIISNNKAETTHKFNGASESTSYKVRITSSNSVSVGVIGA